MLRCGPVRSWFWCSLSFAACQSDAAAPTDKPAAPPPRLSGVAPEDFACTSIVSLERLGELLGAPARALDSVMSYPRGVPAPCTYDVGGETWTYDFDCRPGYKETADALFEDYRSRSQARTAQFDRADPRDAGVIRSDAGVEIRRPGEAREVAVGAKALDHNGVGLIFVDDDAPCYVRINGPDAARRLALASEIAARLTFDTAPMTPRRK